MRHCIGLLRSCVLLGAVVFFLVPPPVRAQPAEEDLQQQMEEVKKATDLFLREQKLIFGKGDFTLELDSFYASDTKVQFVRTGVGYQLAKITDRSVISTLIVRYGLLDNLELDLEIPFGSVSQNADLRVAQPQRRSGSR